jgi:hypothetical protein
MRTGRLGGLLVVGGCILSLPASVLAGDVGPVGTGLRDLGSLIMNASLALGGSGAAVLSAAGPRPLHGRNVRSGLGILAVGLVGLLVASVIPIPAGSDPLQSWPYLISGTVGWLATATGTLVTVLSLTRASDPSRFVGLLFAAGLFLQVVFRLLASGLMSSGTSQVVATLLAALGSYAIVLAVAGVGVLAIKGDRSGPVESV